MEKFQNFLIFWHANVLSSVCLIVKISKSSSYRTKKKKYLEDPKTNRNTVTISIDITTTKSLEKKKIIRKETYAKRKEKQNIFTVNEMEFDLDEVSTEISEFEVDYTETLKLLSTSSDINNSQMKLTFTMFTYVTY